MAVKPIPDGYHSVTPYLIVDGAAEAIQFYKRAFGAAEVLRLPGPDGKIMHAEIQIGNSRLMLADECPAMNAIAPQGPGKAGTTFCLYVDDVDKMVEQAVAAGAKIQRPLQDQFYGDRSATLEDPFNHVWTVATHIEDVAPEEIDRRFAELMQQSQGDSP